jgi:hypothetical protein
LSQECKPTLNWFVDAKLSDKSGLRVPFGALREIEGMDLNRDDFRPTEIAGVRALDVETGLFNFWELANQHSEAFTYAVTPKESAETVMSTLALASQIGAQTPAADDKKSGAALQAKREFLSKAVSRRPTVVGFGGGATSESKAEFGWLIGPRQSAADGQALAYKQVASQYALSALVSVPAWWGRLSLEVTTGWIEQNGKTIRSQGEPTTMDVDLPADFEALEVLLLGIEQIGPELMDVRLDPVLLTACEPGAILIPGRRLWRSTKVTLGNQVADSIFVLPNMKGIIATFDQVKNPLSLEERQRLVDRKTPTQRIRRPVRVWTSQGSLTLPTLASIGVPDKMPPRCPKIEPTANAAQGGGGR